MFEFFGKILRLFGLRGREVQETQNVIIINQELRNLLDAIKEELKPVHTYLEMVDDYVRNQEKVDFRNASFKYSCYILGTLLAYSQQSVYILTGTLSELHLNRIKPFLTDCTRRGVAVKIITIEEDDQQKIDNFKQFSNQANIEYRAFENYGNPKDVQHFFVADKKAWRTEEPHPVIEFLGAEVCFNGSKKARKLAERFMNIWNRHTK